MSRTIRAKALPLVIAGLLAAASAGAQNITTSGINGRVLDASGQPVAGAVVTIVHRPSGTTKEVTTDADGRYSAQGLRVGGPFDVRANKGDAKLAEQDDVFLQLGQPSSINLAAASAAQANSLETVTVSASALTTTFAADNKGLSTTISQRQLDAIPKGNRSIDDVRRTRPQFLGENRLLAPRVHPDRGCRGAGARRRSVTLRSINGDYGGLDLFPRLSVPFGPSGLPPKADTHSPPKVATDKLA